MATVITLITLLVGLLSGLAAGLERQNVSAITGLPADRIAFAAPAGDRAPAYADSAVTAGQWWRWSGTPGVTRAEPLGITTTRAASGGSTTAVSAFGVRPGSPLAPGAVGEGTAVLSATAARDLGAGPGDMFSLAGTDLVVAAVRGDAHFSHVPVVWVGLTAWRRAAPPTSGGERPFATVIALRTSSGTDVDAADLAAGTSTVAKDDSLRAIGSYSSENGSLGLMRIFLFVISALVVGAFFSVWTIQRGGDIAILKALGASTGRLLADALGQASVLLAGGVLAGTGLALAAGTLVAGAVPFVLSPATVLAPAAVTVGLGLLGAALSVRRITSVDPLIALGNAR
ncbi:ABC transporter permease [Actinocorallia herbida]